MLFLKKNRYEPITLLLLSCDGHGLCCLSGQSGIRATGSHIFRHSFRRCFSCCRDRYPHAGYAKYNCNDAATAARRHHGRSRIRRSAQSCPRRARTSLRNPGGSAPEFGAGTNNSGPTRSACATAFGTTGIGYAESGIAVKSFNCRIASNHHGKSRGTQFNIHDYRPRHESPSRATRARLQHTGWCSIEKVVSGFSPAIASTLWQHDKVQRVYLQHRQSIRALPG